jgi:hypothetical protein
MINYEDIEPYLIDYLQGEADEATVYRIKAYLQQNPDFQRELDELEETLDFVETVPVAEPEPALKMNFYAMLNEYKVQKAKTPTLREKLREFMQTQLYWQRFTLASVALLLMMTGVWYVIRLNPFPSDQALGLQDDRQNNTENDAQTQESPTDTKLQTTPKENETLALQNSRENSREKKSNREEISSELRRTPNSKPTVGEDLIENEKSVADEVSVFNEPTTAGITNFDRKTVVAENLSPERIAAIYQVANSPQQQDQIIDQLIDVLNNDPNPNVRMSAIDALERFTAQQRVQFQLIQSLHRQDSPLLQSAMIDVLVRYNVVASAESLRKMLEEENLNPTVREQAEIALEWIG